MGNWVTHHNLNLCIIMFEIDIKLYYFKYVTKIDAYNIDL